MPKKTPEILQAVKRYCQSQPRNTLKLTVTGLKKEHPRLLSGFSESALMNIVWLEKRNIENSKETVETKNDTEMEIDKDELEELLHDANAGFEVDYREEEEEEEEEEKVDECIQKVDKQIQCEIITVASVATAQIKLQPSQTFIPSSVGLMFGRYYVVKHANYFKLLGWPLDKYPLVKLIKDRWHVNRQEISLLQGALRRFRNFLLVGRQTIPLTEKEGLFYSKFNVLKSIVDNDTHLVKYARMLKGEYAMHGSIYHNESDLTEYLSSVPMYPAPDVQILPYGVLRQSEGVEKSEICIAFEFFDTLEKEEIGKGLCDFIVENTGVL